MAISPQDFADFQALVDTNDRHTERECAKYLHHAAALLVPQTPISTHIAPEDRNYFGSTDLVVTAVLLDDRNQEETVAYLWELKSPQTYLFERDDNNNRCRPTAAFIKAENQLIHYAAHAVADQHFLRRFKLTDHRNIRVGGIIIGRSKDRLLSGSTDPYEVDKAKFALSVRENFFYATQRIRILTWDRVLEFVRP